MVDNWILTADDAGVHIRGEIDLSTAADFRERLQMAVRDAAGTFLIDLSEVTFMDSSAVRSLLVGVEFARGADVVVRASRQTFTILDLVGLTRGEWANVVVMPPPEDDVEPV